MRFLHSWLLGMAFTLQLFSQQRNFTNLKPGMTRKAELVSGQPQSYTFKLKSGQYLRLGIFRPSFATVARLWGPSQPGPLFELHWPGAPQVREPLYWIAAKSGVYRFELAVAGQTPLTGAYSITLEEARKSAADDTKQVAVQQLFEKARTLDERRQYNEAIAVWNQALAASRELSDREREAASLNGLAASHENLGQSEKAFAFYDQALAVCRVIGDRLGEGHALRNMGRMSSNLGQLQKAVTYQEQALEIARQIKDRNGEARALANLAFSAQNTGQTEKAIDLYQQALAMLRETKDRNAEGRLLVNLGMVYNSTSRYDQAIDIFEQGATIVRETKDRRSEGLALGNIGNAYYNMSFYEKAINYYTSALEIRREMKDPRDEANMLAGLGNTFMSLGQNELSIANYEKALSIFRTVKYRLGEDNTLRNLGTAYRNSNRPAQAIPYYEQSLAISLEGKNLRNQGRALNLLGSAHQELQQLDRATGYFEQAITISRQAKDRTGEGMATGNLGAVHAAKAQQQAAIALYEQALNIARETKSRQLETVNLTRLMDSWKALGQPRMAVFYGKQAVNVIQSVRSGIRGLAQDLQGSFLKGNEEPYHKLADLLIAQGRLSEAEQVLGLLKDQEFFEFVRRDATETSSNQNGAALTTEEADWAKRYAQVGGGLVALGTERSELLARQSLTPEQSKRLTQIEEDLKIGSQAFDSFITNLATHFSGRPDANAKIEMLKETQGFMSDLGEMPPGSVAIYTLVGEDKYRAILITSQVQKAYEYPIKAADLNRKVLEFREVIRNPKLDPRPRANELYKILIGSMAEDLKQAKTVTIMFSLDGTLRYLPLSALYDGEHYMIEQYKLAVFTPASNARMKDKPTAQWKAAGFGVTKGFEGAPALPSVAAEMSGIIVQNAGSSEGVLSGELRLDADFTKDTMRSTLRRTFPVVHIASHFKFQPGNDASSFLLLGDGSHFSLAELKSVTNLFAGVQLLTLSACNTGVGDVPGDGKEVEGFGVLAQRQGAKAVIASLWPVADASTSLLMREFYRIRESSPGITKAEALARAQIQLLHGTAKPRAGSGQERALIHEESTGRIPIEAPSFAAPANAPYAHPYYWAPFFLMGNWL